MNLSEEQQKRIEESRARALALRASRLHHPVNSSTGPASAAPFNPSSVPAAPHKYNASVPPAIALPPQRGYEGDGPDAKRFRPAVGSAVKYTTTLRPCPDTVTGPTGGVSSATNQRPSDSSPTQQTDQTVNVVGASCRLAVNQKVSGSLSAAASLGGVRSNVNLIKNAAQRASGVGGRDGGVVCGVVEGVVVKLVLVLGRRFVAEARYCPPLLELFKALDTRQYDPKTKNWSFDLSDYTSLVDQVKRIGRGVTLDPIPDYVLSVFGVRRGVAGGDKDKSVRGSGAGGQRSEVEGSEVKGSCCEDYLAGVDERLRSTLLPFQREAVRVAVQRGGRLLVADDMGLGKTLEALAVAAHYRAEWPLLIVAPSSVLYAWRQQLLDWLPSVRADRVVIVQSGRDQCLAGEASTGLSESVFILSYDIMAKCQAQLLDRGFRIVIMDESHLLKNAKTARTRKAVPLLKSASRVLLLSGTPALSRPSELYTQLSVVDRKFFPQFHTFGMRYCSAKQLPWGWDYSGSSNLAELQLVMEQRLMVRRLKSDVLTQLPPKYRSMVVLNPATVSLSRTMKASHSHVNAVKGNERRGALLEYFHESGAAKVNAIREYILDLLEADKKFLVFAHHQNVLDAVEEAVEQNYAYVRIDGRTSSEARTAACELFQSKGSVRVAILSIQAANSGLNLSAASLVVFAELFWNPGILVQAEDRVHRIGQLDSVNIQYLVARNTADDFIWPLIQQKLDVLSKAGLSKDNFSDADTHHMQDNKQPDLLSYFRDEFIDSADPSDPSLTSGVSVDSTNTTLAAAPSAVSRVSGAQRSMTSYLIAPTKVPAQADGQADTGTDTERDRGRDADRLTEPVAHTSSDIVDDLWDDDDDNFGDLVAVGV